ncbi:MAG: hypothetical protein V7K30_20175 [Nostoc sp.]
MGNLTDMILLKKAVKALIYRRGNSCRRIRGASRREAAPRRVLPRHFGFDA